MTMDHSDDDDILAAEYVTGLMDLADRTGFETRLRNDPALAARVTDWENRLSGLNDDYADAPAPDLLPQIEARLFPQAPRRNWLANLWLWGATATAGLVLILYLALTPASPDFTATLVAEGGTLQFQAVITDGSLTLTRTAGSAADAAHSHELWIIAGDNPPVSLGVLPGDSVTLSLPGATPGAVLAVSEEQPGGSPDGTPHGPIVAAGTLTAA